jgi:hypothetical protein
MHFLNFSQKIRPQRVKAVSGYHFWVSD